MTLLAANLIFFFRISISAFYIINIKMPYEREEGESLAMDATTFTHRLVKSLQNLRTSVYLSTFCIFACLCRITAFSFQGADARFINVAYMQNL